MANFPDSFLSAIRDAIAPSQICGRTVKLTQRGNEFTGLSPFKSEKTPSFTVNDEKGFYHCFSSGKHGDIFRFLMETEGYTFPEAVEYLAGMAGIPIPVRDSHQEADNKARTQKNLVLRQILDRSAAIYVKTLGGTNDGAVRNLLRERNLNGEVVAKFEVGHAPLERRYLIDKLLQDGFDIEVMLEAGVATRNGDDIRDRMRNRLIFPIRDSYGKMVGFGGRRIGDSSAPKYLNTAETALFVKGKHLYNLFQARSAAAKEKNLIVVEGYMDVIALHHAGLANAVAPLGTALTEAQIRLLWRICDEPTLCFDGDEAGQNAAMRASQVAVPMLQPGKSLRFAFLPHSTDPDDMVRSGQVVELRKIIGSPSNLCDVLWNAEMSRSGIDTPERMTRFVAEVERLCDRISDASVRQAYRDQFGARIRELRGIGNASPGTSYEPSGRRSDFYRSGNNRASGSGGRSRFQQHRPVIKRDIFPHRLREAAIVRGMIVKPSRVVDNIEEMALLSITVPDFSRLRDVVVWELTERPLSTPEELEAAIIAAGLFDTLEKITNVASSSLFSFLSEAGSETEAHEFEQMYRDICEQQRSQIAKAEDVRAEGQEMLETRTAEQWNKLTEAIRRARP